MKKILLLVTILMSSLLASDISTYLKANIQTQDEVEKSLKKVGFDVIGSYNAMQNPDYRVIVYTSAQLKQLSAKDNRAFSAVQKVMISKKDNSLFLTNPEYYLKAMLQDDINDGLARQVSNRLNSAFTLTNGDYSMEDSELSGFHFMFGMPYYEDMLEVGSGDNLNSKLKQNATNNIVFELKVANATLYGISMNDTNGEKDYVGILKEEKSSAFLPYMVMVKDNKAMILHPKYYLALSLPKLTMGEFMNIMETPAHIEDYFINLFE